MYIRTRLTIWFVAIMALVLAVLSYAVYQLTRDSLLREVQQDVRQRATVIAASAGGAAGTSLVTSNTDMFSAPDVFVQFVDPSGQVLSGSSNLSGRRLPFDRSAIQSDRVEDVRVGGRPLVLYGRPVAANGQTIGYVLVARSPVTIYRALARLRSILYPGAALALLLAGVAGWLLVRQAMRPLDRVARVASEIAATRDHARRLGHRGPADEIGRLALTIDGMLAALEDAHRQLQELNASQRQFLVDVSHELRTPLTIMLSSLDLLARVGRTDPEFQPKALADMRVEANRMARMVSQLLIMARSDAGATVAYEPVLIADSVADACRQLTSDGRQVSVECSGLERLGDAVVNGNPDYLKQLFLILLDNAYKYTPAGGHVTVSGALDRDRVTVTVADTGMGIASEDLPHVFDRFYRAENAKDKEGMGLGLAIARHIAAQHGGSIEVESDVGIGSRFTVSLPVTGGGAGGDDQMVAAPEPVRQSAGR